MTGHDVITWVAKWHQSIFLLSFVPCAIICYKDIPPRASIVDFKGVTILWNVALISLNASFRKIVQLKACLWIFPHSYFIKISYHMWCINWWKYYVCAPCTENAPQVWNCTSIARSTHDHVLLNFVGSVHDEEWWIGFEENILNQSDYKNIKCGW